MVDLLRQRATQCLPTSGSVKTVVPFNALRTAWGQPADRTYSSKSARYDSCLLTSGS